MTVFKLPSNNILQFWFGECAHQPESLRKQARLWFAGHHSVAGLTVDDYVAKHYGGSFETAAAHYTRSLVVSLSCRELLAAIILFDQFSRNCFRATARAYTYDELALRLMDAAIARNCMLTLPDIYCLFLVMPLQHAECLQRQNQGVSLFRALCERAKPPYREYLQGTLKYALEHRDIIARFGRFPHRNAVLGRQSTAQEMAYLKNAKRFGQ